uniref:LOW QUALITY PROTEIN: protein-glutamine gamma-glutamyltransferase 5-like n=1 Tax=Gasterosteus aculeatus aculeatus TaxID=481459 RepID=UPI001A985CE6|nr:LOW QUALITY PROTEIN: protein-glutamine gamma-glutamyltransferase 5-like [Gasterosteus aculeatus aculeatus]
MDCIQQTTHAWGFKSNCQLGFVNFETHENHISHETEGLSYKHLVVRRGKPFKLTLLFRSQMWNPRNENLVLEVCLGNLSARIPVQFSKEKYNPDSWSAKIYPGGLHPESVEVHVCSPVLSSVALHRLLLHLETRQTRRSYSVGDFVLLCNPWLKDDPVYMPMDVQIQEYIRSDYGLLYMGTCGNIGRRPWSFGQYEPGVLEACLKLLEVSPQHFMDKDEDYMRRADPVYLSRVICAMVNRNDDMGILDGKWQGGYSGGVNPTEWSGSADILHQWVSSNCQAVRYGQCWVFAGVLCTVMRVLGIPCRVVTVFNAAHDGDANLTIEEFYSTTGEKLNLSKDSIWNFHVWVECWMTRGDLGAEFDGWQVVDPTPQERSAGVFCCGPCPVAAVRERRYDARYDAPFIYASVDADVVRGDPCVCMCECDARRSRAFTVCVLYIFKTAFLHIFFPIAGKQPGVSMTRYSAGVRCSARSLQTDQSQQSSELAVSLSVDGLPSAGENISLCVTVTNQSSRPRLLTEHLNAQLKAFNSHPERSFWKTHKEVRVRPGEVLTLHHSIPPAEYEAFLAGDDIVNVAVVIKDEKTKERVLAAQEFNISSPQISVEIEGGDSIQMKKEYTARVSFINPFTKVLSGAVLTVKGSGLLQGRHQERRLLLQPGEKLVKTVTIAASSAGTKLLMATFSHSSSAGVVSRSFHKVYVTAA